MTIFVREVEEVVASDETKLRTIQLKSKNATVELCSVGASIHRFVYDGKNLVLGYKTVRDLYESRNPPYLAVIVGRVANRIQKGTFVLNKGTTYTLDTNNGPNHLHGGNEGFSHRVWDVKVLEDGVKFSLQSPDGDQGYPGGIEVSATYRLREHTEEAETTLSLEMKARLVDSDENGNLSSPINLAQHTYWNLAGHDSPVGVLDHSLHMPTALSYTPVDPTSIPTGEVRKVAGDAAMDFTTPRELRQALKTYGQEKAGLTDSEASEHVEAETRVAMSPGSHPTNPNEPYGFDHNYCLEGTGSKVAGIVESSGRRLTVSTTAPGVQLYTANWLDANDEIGTHIPYQQWQGICLETQSYPNGILKSDDASSGEFGKGRCFILEGGGADYHHVVEYKLESIAECSQS